MKRMIFTGLGLLACGAFAGSAAAADMDPRYRQQQPYVKAPLYNPAFSWTGFYLGLNGGGGWGSSHWDRASDLDLSGGLIGGTAGFNWQMGQVVVGIEGDADWSGISGTTSHPELFLRMMEGCGFSRSDFGEVELLPAAHRYRMFLDEISGLDHWVLGAAVLTIFVEGSVNERREMEKAGPDSDSEIEAAIRQHPLVRVHGLDPKFLDLQRVHKKVEGGHRLDAWKMVLGHAPATLEGRVVQMVERALERWLAYRDDVAEACGIAR